MTDTDSFIYEIKTEDVLKNLWEHKQFFGYFGYSKDSPYYDETNKKVSGKFNDKWSYY